MTRVISCVLIVVEMIFIEIEIIENKILEQSTKLNRSKCENTARVNII